MNRFIKELEIGEIHLRDKWQFELKSEYFPLEQVKKNTYTQEFYLFIPNSLQISEETYSKRQFYDDLTNLIRFKTPLFSLKELYDKNNDRSPLTRLGHLRHAQPTGKHLSVVEEELKLLGNIFRSSLREQIKRLVNKLGRAEPPDEGKINDETKQLCEEVKTVRDTYLTTQGDFLKHWPLVDIQNCFLYLDEFMSNCVNDYLTGFLKYLLKSKISNTKSMRKALTEVLVTEKKHRESILREPLILEEDSLSSEFILYRRGLLKKFVINALLLNTTRSFYVKRFGNLIGSISAGIAMLFFFVLFVWQGQVVLINSLPFIFITVLLYVLKDRIKESIRALSYRQFSKWFYDYKTEIRSPDENVILGEMKESSSFVDEKELPAEIIRIRNREFHNVLEAFKRPERVIYYKKTISIFKPDKPQDSRRNALNIILRFNIYRFLRKAEDPSHSYVTIDPETLDLIEANLPKVYHLNIILRNTYMQKNGKTKIELKKFRLILDKNGLKRVQHVHHPE